MGKRKVAVVGLDSITPVMIDRFVDQGRMPNLRRLRDKGFWAEVTPTMPPTTPAGWTTVATGAWPSTHGIEGFAVHRRGDPLDRKTHACSSDLVRAEFIWQAAERAGRRTILLKYPVSWPPTGGPGVLQVDGAGGWGGLKCVWDLAHSGCWTTPTGTVGPAPGTAEGDGDAGVAEEWITRDQDNLADEAPGLLEPRAPQEWAGLPAGARPLWEAELAPFGERPGSRIHLLALDLDGESRLLPSTDRDAAGRRPLGRGDWSDWLRVAVAGPDGERWGHIRFKVMEFDAPTRRLRLYQTQVHQEDGYTVPAPVAAELLAAAGPFVEWTESYERLQGWIDDETQLEVYGQHVEWMIRATRRLLRHHPWDLFLTELHFVDMAYHLYWGAVMPGHPQYDPDKAPLYWDLLGRAHEMADRYVGAVLDELGDDGLIVVLGDHGHDLYHTNFLANHLLLREGLLVLYRDRRTGAPRIDWKRTRALASSYRVYLNVAGRDPQGIIPETERQAVVTRVVESLYRVRDPRTGQAPVRLALGREDAASIGLYGDSMGDVVFAMAPGYQTRSTIGPPPGAWAGGRLQPDRTPLFTQTEMFGQFTGDHDTSLPFTRSIHTLLYLHGPGVRPGQTRVPVRLVDVAPTICHYLDIPLPAQSEGAVLEAALNS